MCMVQPFLYFVVANISAYILHILQGAPCGFIYAWNPTKYFDNKLLCYYSQDLTPQKRR